MKLDDCDLLIIPNVSSWAFSISWKTQFHYSPWTGSQNSLPQPLINFQQLDWNEIWCVGSSCYTSGSGVCFEIIQYFEKSTSISPVYFISITLVSYVSDLFITFREFFFLSIQMINLTSFLSIPLPSVNYTLEILWDMECSTAW